MTVKIYEESEIRVVLKSDDKEFKERFGQITSMKTDLFYNMSKLNEFCKNILGEEIIFEMV